MGTGPTTVQFLAIIAVMIAAVAAVIAFGTILFTSNSDAAGKPAQSRPACEETCRHVRKMEFVNIGIVIAVSCVAILTILLAGDSNAFANISFASTVSSIILSVIAIFMSISGEVKVSNTKEKMDLTVGKLDEAIQQLEEYKTEMLQELAEQKEVFDHILVESKRIHEGVDELKKNLPQQNIDMTGEPKLESYQSNHMTEEF